MADSGQKLNVLEKEVLSCPVCFENDFFPVFQCQNGHLICQSCLDQITDCPTCRERMPIFRIRNLIAEQIATQECPHSKWGCQVRLRAEEKEDHVLNCQSRSIDYCHRIRLEKIGLPPCETIVKISDIQSHMKDHGLQIINSAEATISQEADKWVGFAGQKWQIIIFHAFDTYFFFDTGIFPEDKYSFIDSGEQTIFWKCISAGSVTFANQFSTEITLFNLDKNLSLAWKGPVISIDQLQDRNLNHFALPMSSLYQFNQNPQKISWAIKVSIFKNYPTNPLNQVTPTMELNDTVHSETVEQVNFVALDDDFSDDDMGYGLFD